MTIRKIMKTTAVALSIAAPALADEIDGNDAYLIEEPEITITVTNEFTDDEIVDGEAFEEYVAEEFDDEGVYYTIPEDAEDGMMYALGGEEFTEESGEPVVWLEDGEIDYSTLDPEIYYTMADTGGAELEPVVNYAPGAPEVQRTLATDDGEGWQRDRMRLVAVADGWAIGGREGVTPTPVNGLPVFTADGSVFGTMTGVTPTEDGLFDVSVTLADSSTFILRTEMRNFRYNGLQASMTGAELLAAIGS